MATIKGIIVLKNKILAMKVKFYAKVMILGLTFCGKIATKPYILTCDLRIFNFNPYTKTMKSLPCLA